MTNGGHPHSVGPAKTSAAKKKGKAKPAAEKPTKWTASSLVPKKK